MKQLFKRIVAALLGRQVRALRRRHQFTTIGVVGSIGKTSTKRAIAQTLSASGLRVQWQDGNYNDWVSAPLIYFGHPMPPLFNTLAWLLIMLRNLRQIYGAYPYDVVVVEYGTDGPGQIAGFARFGQLDLAVLTAIAPEHMEYFADLDAVAFEETCVKDYANHLAYAADFVAAHYRTLLPAESVSYAALGADAQYQISRQEIAAGQACTVMNGSQKLLTFTRAVVSEVELSSLLAAVVASQHLGIDPATTAKALASVHPAKGRLNQLAGLGGSVIIDDTYNASPEAVKAALAALAARPARTRIAILGSMNELGAMSAEAHRSVGELCTPSTIDLVVTIGADAAAYLAPAAIANGCTVASFDTPYDAGDFVARAITPETVILAKGSQNGVFAEEAVKRLLANPSDTDQLVRQSPDWLAIKRRNFPGKS